MSEKVGIAAPWIGYARKVRALFANDPDVIVEYDNENMKLNLRVNGTAKADALAQLLPTEKEFGNVVLAINVIPANGGKTCANLLKDALIGNNAFYDIIDFTKDTPYPDVVYVVFDNNVVQYPNDNLSHYAGVETTLYADIAKEVFENVDGNVYFNTIYDEDNDLHSDIPSGVWPVD